MMLQSDKACLTLLCSFIALCFISTFTFSQTVEDCKICEDVVQTWHDQFRCAGEYLDWGDDMNLNFIDGCKKPTLDCSKFAGDFERTCKGGLEFLHELAPRVWENNMGVGKFFEFCKANGKCIDGDEKNNCNKIFETRTCGKNPVCKDLLTNCTAPCYTCVWQLRDYPLFQETCKPEGAKLPDDTKTFLEIQSTTTRQRRRNEFRLAQQVGTRARARAEVGLGEGTGEGAQTLSITTRYRKCLDYWNEVAMSPKARYFASWKRYVGVMQLARDRLTSNMWDANIACKCLGKCPLKRFEDLGLAEACYYGPFEQQLMDKMIDLEHKDALVLDFSTTPPTGFVKSTKEADANLISSQNTKA